MKILFLILTISSHLLGQTDSILTYSYFPLQVGNEWCYRSYTSNNYGTKETLFNQTVICDTIMPNGKLYFGINNNLSSEIVFYREDIESKKLYLYGAFNDSSEILFYDFNSNQATYNSDLFGMINVITGIDSIKNLILYKPFIEFSYNSTYGIAKYIFSEGIGNTWYKHISPNEIIVGEIEYARINGKTFGQITNIHKKTNLINSDEYIKIYPNPFNSQTTLLYKIFNAGDVNIKIYNSLGELVEDFGSFYREQGEYEQKIFLENYNSGLYFCQLFINEKRYTVKLLHIK